MVHKELKKMRVMCQKNTCKTKFFLFGEKKDGICPTCKHKYTERATNETIKIQNEIQISEDPTNLVTSEPQEE